jgi:hypothetical protein
MTEEKDREVAIALSQNLISFHMGRDTNTTILALAT